MRHSRPVGSNNYTWPKEQACTKSWPEHAIFCWLWAVGLMTGACGEITRLCQTVRLRKLKFANDVQQADCEWIGAEWPSGRCQLPYNLIQQMLAN